MRSSAGEPGTVGFPFSVSARFLRWLLLLLGVGVVIVVAGTWLAMNPERIPGWVPEWGRFLVFQMDLGPENRIGTWYSSFLFLLPAPLALACYGVQRRTASDRGDRIEAYVWLGVAVMFVMMSATELGSIHNRMAIFLSNPLRGAGLRGWVGLLAIPIAIVGTGLLWFSWRLIRAQRSVGVVLGLATLILLSIPVQEEIETRLRPGFRGEHGEYLRPALHVILEEGGEMLSAFLFITAFVMFLAARLPALRARGWFAPDGKPTAGLTVSRADTDALLRSGRLEGVVRIRADHLRVALYGLVVAIAIGMILFYIWFEVWWADAPEHLGRPLNWFPAQLAALAALVAIYLSRRGPEVSDRLARARTPLLALALFSLVVAANQGSHLAMVDVLWEGSPRRQLALALSFAAGALVIGGWLAIRLKEAGRLLVGLWALGLAYVFATVPNDMAAPVVAAAYGALLVGLRRACERGVMPTRLPLPG